MLIGAIIGCVIGSIFRQGFIGTVIGAWLGYLSKKHGFIYKKRTIHMIAWGLFGFCAGSVLGLSLFGLLLGLYVGYSFKSNHKPSFTFDGFAFETDNFASSKPFIQIAFHTIGFLAKAGGAVKNDDIAFARKWMSEFQYSSKKRDMAMRAFRLGREQHESPISILKRHQIWLLSALKARQMLVHIVQQYESERQLNSKQRVTIDQFYTFLGVRRYRSRQSYQSSQTGSTRSRKQPLTAYQVLELGSNASVDDIKKAYRKLMARYHPDRVISKGYTEEEVKLYTEKAKNVQQAYATLKELKGF